MEDLLNVSNQSNILYYQGYRRRGGAPPLILILVDALVQNYLEPKVQVKYKYVAIYYHDGQFLINLCIMSNFLYIGTSPYIIENVPIGEHRIKVVPQGCGQLGFIGYTQRFSVF